MDAETLSREAKHKLSVVGSRMIFDHTFWATALLRLNKKEMSPEFIKMLHQSGLPDTMCTDGISIYYNPSFVMSMSAGELEFILAHEVMHNIHEHQIRRQGRNGLLWNVATDFAINGILVNCRVGKPPKDILIDSRFDKMNAEEIYNKLMKNAKKMKVPANMAGLVADAPSSTSADAQRATWKEIVADAAARARAIGNLPADLEKLVTDWIEPKAPWQEKIAWWFQDRIKGSYTWTKRNRRVPDIYLPSRDDEIQGKIVLAFDTSGSMWFTKDIFKRVLGAISELLAIYKCEADIIDIDTRVSRHTHIAAGENIEKYSPSGGGGTSFVPAFEWTKKNLPSKPDGLIYFTDLEGVFPNEPPDYPVLWVTWREKPGNPPFGALLVIDEK